jgi:hypothetical protein
MSGAAGFGGLEPATASEWPPFVFFAPSPTFPCLRRRPDVTEESVSG